jgi:uncharacterized membrane protein YphA (DoxX/SURF4 family)
LLRCVSSVSLSWPRQSVRISARCRARIGTVIELVTGTLISLGLFTRVAAFIASGEMAVGYWMFHAPASLYPAANGATEMPTGGPRATMPADQVRA